MPMNEMFHLIRIRLEVLAGQKEEEEKWLLNLDGKCQNAEDIFKRFVAL